MSDVWLIANPASGRKAGITFNPVRPGEALAALSRHGIDAHLRVTERAGDGTRLALEAVAHGARTVVAAGGDGTAREVAQGIIGSGATLALLPLGSFMNLGRALGIPRDLDGAAALIASGSVGRLDIGRATTRRTSTYFLETAGAGWDTGLFVYGNRLDAGDWRSLARLVRWVRHYRPGRVWLEVDGRREKIRPFMITIANAPFTGVGLPLAPEALFDDGQLDVIVRRRVNGWELIRRVAGMAVGRPFYPPIRTRRGRVIRLEHTRRPLMVHADGQSIGPTPAEFEVLPGFLSVIVGRQHTLH